jgi:predicted protein tyrosine phosphatase
MLNVFVYPQSVIDDRSVEGDALIAIRPGHSLFVPRPNEWPLGILQFDFDDIPCPRWEDEGRVWIGPSAANVEDAILFGRKVYHSYHEADLVVHCTQGKSRSAAIALAIVADQYGLGCEADAVRYMLERDTMKRMCFNPGIVRLAEDFLGCERRLEEALEAACPEFVSWKAFWVKHGCFTEDRQVAGPPTGKIAD